MIQSKPVGLIKTNMSALAKWNQIILVHLPNIVCPFTLSLLSECFICPWELTLSIPCVSAALVTTHRWEVSAEEGPVSPSSASRSSTPCTWEKVFCLCSQSHCSQHWSEVLFLASIFSFFLIQSLSIWGTDRLGNKSTEGGICLCSHPLLHAVLDGSPEMMVKKWWLCCVKRTVAGFNLSEYSLYFLVLQFCGGFSKWAVPEESTKINCLSSGNKV